MEIPTLEREYVSRGFSAVAGVDEVGRGPLAGPVVCAAVVMPLSDALLVAGVNDSKKLSAKKRELLAERIRAAALAYAIEEVGADVIDEINILQATRLCMKRAVEKLSPPADMVLTDGNMTLDIRLPQRSVVKGDALVYSIGAASILAKVHRDALMRDYAALYPEYGFERNAGYGTAEHIRAIREVGICPIHRRTFVTKFWDGRERTCPAAISNAAATKLSPAITRRPSARRTSSPARGIPTVSWR